MIAGADAGGKMRIADDIEIEAIGVRNVVRCDV